MQYKQREIYADGQGRQFEVTEHWLDQGDPWVRYINTQTLQEYQCRQEAFLSRFYLHSN